MEQRKKRELTDRQRAVLQQHAFQPGESGNPTGRPKDLLTQVIRAQLTEADAKAIADMLIREAKAGNLKAAEVLWDRLEGKPTVRQELTGAGGQPVRISTVEVRLPESDAGRR